MRENRGEREGKMGMKSGDRSDIVAPQQARAIGK